MDSNVIIKFADELEKIEARMRSGEVRSILISVNYGETSQNEIFGNITDLSISISHLFRKVPNFNTLILQASIVATQTE